jgi:hypothetical protein
MPGIHQPEPLPIGEVIGSDSSRFLATAASCALPLHRVIGPSFRKSVLLNVFLAQLGSQDLGLPWSEFGLEGQSRRESHRPNLTTYPKINKLGHVDN